MKTPLEFVRTAQALQWKNGTRLSIPGTWVDSGTMPAGSTWAMNPVSPHTRLRCTATDAVAQWPQIPRIDNTYDKNVDRSPLCEGKGFPPRRSCRRRPR